MIQIQNVSRRYGPVVAVNGVSVQIARGEVVGLLGHNGAGKTTLMKMLTGFIEPSDGTLTVGGFDVVRSREEAQRLIGYLPENAPLYPEMLVQDYLLMMADLRGVSADRVAAAVGRAVVATGLQDRLLQPIGTLSKGYRQRVGIAQAIVHEPAVLVLDEPTNGLDPAQIQSIRDLVRRLARRTTVLLSTHILQEVEAVCDRVLVMIDGHLAADAPLTTLLSSEFVRLAVSAGTPGVMEALAPVAGVIDAAKRASEDPTVDVWAIRCAAGARPTPEILKVAAAKGWTVDAIAPETLTLQRVFERLQAEQIRTRAEVAS